MVLVENVLFRWREWRDAQQEEPDLVPRLRRVWTAPRVPDARETATRTSVLRRHPALHARPGV